MEDAIIRSATVADAGAIQEIYAYYVECTAISFEYDAPSIEEMERRIKETLKEYPYLVAEADGHVVGYAYAGKFHTRAAYLYSAELSVYVDKDYRGHEIGKKLYREIEELLKKKHIVRIYAGIAVTDAEDPFLTDASIRFHIAMGYRQVARFHQCGYKFKRWYDLVYMEKELGELF